MRVLIALITLVYILYSSTTMAQDIVNPFENPPIFRADFHEEKYIPQLERPITSEGDFIYVRDEGMSWIMTTPFSMKTVIGPSGLRQWVNEVEQKQSVSVQKNMAHILDNISAVFSGDMQTLSTQFTIKKEMNKDGQHILTLTPKSDALKPYLRHIILSGTRYVETVKTVFADNKYTLTTYSNVQTGENVLTQEERSLLEQ